jgi:hypothetical protein
MNKTYQYPYITEGYRDYMSCARHHTMGEWYICAVRQKKLSQFLKSTSTLPHLHQPAINPYDKSPE